MQKHTTSSQTDWERAARDYARDAVSRRTFLGLAGAGAVVGLVGCGSDSTESTESSPTTAGGESPSEATGGALIVARGQSSDSLDPHKSGLLVAHEVMWQIFDSLVYLDADGIVYPGLATSWEFSEDNKTLTFSLRENVSFHDGTPFDAEAVKFTMDRWLDPETASPTSYMAGPLSSVTVVDPLTVEFQYEETFVPIFVGLGYSYGAPISPAAVEEHGDLFGRNPVGTGPYKFEDWGVDETITLSRNAEHDWATPMYLDASGNALDTGGSLDSVEFRVIPQPATRVSALRAGEVDMIAGTGSVPDNQVSTLQDLDDIQIIQRAASGTYYAYLNTTVAPLDDVRVRQAINYAVDKETLVKLAISGQGKPADSLVGSAFGAYDGSVEKYEFDLDKAKALMEEAGQSEGFDLDFLVINDAQFESAIQVVQENLAKININVKVEALPVGQVIEAAGSGDPGATFFYYTFSDPDILTSLIRSGAGFNYSKQDDPELDELLDAQRVEFDADKRTEMLHQIQQRIADQAYCLMLWEGLGTVAARSDIENIRIDMVGFVHIQEINKVASS